MKKLTATIKLVWSYLKLTYEQIDLDIVIPWVYLGIFIMAMALAIVQWGCGSAIL